MYDRKILTYGDYQVLNFITILDRYLISHIQDFFLVILHGAAIFSLVSKLVYCNQFDKLQYNVRNQYNNLRIPNMC